MCVGDATTRPDPLHPRGCVTPSGGLRRCRRGRARRTPPGRQGHIGRDGVWAICLLSLTGMWRDQIRDLRWEQVNWRQKVLRPPDSKTGMREIVASDVVMALLGKIGQAKGHP